MNIPWVPDMNFQVTTKNNPKQYCIFATLGIMALYLSIFAMYDFPPCWQLYQSCGPGIAHFCSQMCLQLAAHIPDENVVPNQSGSPSVSARPMVMHQLGDSTSIPPLCPNSGAHTQRHRLHILPAQLLSNHSPSTNGSQTVFQIPPHTLAPP